LSLWVHGNVVVLWVVSVPLLSGEITSNAEVLVSICITSARNMGVEQKSFNDVFFSFTVLSHSPWSRSVQMKSEILSSSAALLLSAG